MIELTFTIKAGNIDEALDALTGVYLRTENEELMRLREEYRERLASLPGEDQGSKDVVDGAKRRVLHDCEDENGSDENNGGKQ